jgi:hypothetical protein
MIIKILYNVTKERVFLINLLVIWANIIHETEINMAK